MTWTNGIFGPIGRADVGGGGLVELVHMDVTRVLRLGTQKCIGGLLDRGERGGPPVEQVRTALELQVLGVAIIKDDPHLFDITAAFGRDFELLVAEGLQILQSVGSCRSAALTMSPSPILAWLGFNKASAPKAMIVFHAHRGREGHSKDRVATHCRCGQICTGACRPRFQRQVHSPPDFGHLTFVGVPHVGTGQTHPLSFGSLIEKRTDHGPSSKGVASRCSGVR